MNLKQEAPTALAYVKLRNWREIEVQSPQQNGIGQEMTTQFYDEPCLVHVDYQTFVATVLRHVDSDRRVHAFNMSTGRESVSDPIQSCDLSLAKPDERNRVSRNLAQRLYEAAREIVHYRGHLRLSAGQDPEEFDLALMYEGHLAGLLAPYLTDSELLAVAATIAANSQTEGRLTALESDINGLDVALVQAVGNS